MTAKHLLTAAAGAALLAAPLAADPREARPDDPTCAKGGAPAVLVSVVGLKSGAGKVRVQAYHAAGFLKKGQWAGRVDVNPAGRRNLDICLPLKAPGSYAIAVRHDANDNDKSDWNDGGGFSRNPRLSLMGKPSFAQTAINVGREPARIRVVMNYRRGLTIAPVR